MKLAWTLLPILFASSWPAAEPPPEAWKLANAAIEVTLRANGALTVLDRASNTRWESVVAHNPAAVSSVAVNEGRNSLKSRVEIAGTAFDLSLSLDGAEPGFDLALSAPAATPLHSILEYPYPLRAPSGQYRLVLPHQTGLLLPVDYASTNPKFIGKYPCYLGNGLSMPWTGMSNLEGGLMLIIDTPEGAGMNERIENGAFAANPYWMPSWETVGYARKLHYRLFERGGYVAMCKYYRNRLIRAGQFVTLRDKQKSRPQLSKLKGMIDLHMRGSDQEQIDLVRKLEAKGVKRILVNSGASHETLDWMRARGDLVGSYRLYTDIYPASPNSRGREEVTRGYPQDAYTLKDGGPTRGFAYSDARKSTYRCSIRQLELMKDLVPPLVREHGYEAIFLDVVTASAPRECYSKDHPLDRLQDQQKKIEILKYVRDLGLVVGSEDGSAWATPYLEYFEGMAMPRRFGYIKGVTINNWPQKFDLDDEYMNVELGEKVRAPLWDLVFHDSVVSTWRWNFTPDRYSDPKWWNKHDLMYIIGGDMPIFPISLQSFAASGDRVAETYRDVCEWNAKIAWDELVDHQDLTADRSVQESRFSSGWAVTVNFSETRPYEGGGTVLKPWSHKVYRWKN
jgi:hypothetical protein